MSTILPGEFLRSLISDFNIEKELFEKTHLDRQQVTSVRLNKLKPFPGFSNTVAVPWCSTGFYLPERPLFIGDPFFHAGCYYVQEASSMFLEQVVKHSVNLDHELHVLDLCAAPGGKSTHLLSLINKKSILVSNEIIKTRTQILTDNLVKWGSPMSFVSNNDPKDFARLEGYFDLLVIDAPCSGSGMFRKDPDTIQYWSEDNVQLCSQRQQRILADAFPALKENGILIYSTCSYSKQENEFIADWLCDEFDMESIQIPTDKSWGISETRSDKHHCYGYRFYPHQVMGEGFFISCFRKKLQTEEVKFPKQKMAVAGKKETQLLNGWIDHSEDYTFMPLGNNYIAIQNEHTAHLNLLQSKLYLKKAGIRAGSIQGSAFIPDHELALSSVTGKNIQKLDLEREQALHYLRKDDIKSGSTLSGWTLMCYKGSALGWAKILPNRINNYYPKNLRILKTMKDLNTGL